LSGDLLLTFTVSIFRSLQQLILQVKVLAHEAGGIRSLKQLVDALAE
jgi:hypothetical protein